MGWLLEFATEGFLAFATGLLLLSYLLLRKIIDSKDGNDKNILIRCNIIQKFMLASIIVITMGMISEYLSPKITIKFDVSPHNEIAEGLKIIANGKEINITTKNFSMRDEDHLTLDLEILANEIRKLSNKLTFNRAVAEGIKKQVEKMKKEQVKEDLKNISSKEEGI